jgi:hypothetical protein
MDYLIIVCLHSRNQCLWLREDARRPAWWHQPELRAPFFCEEALLARVLQSHATLGKAHRCPMGKSREGCVGKRTQRREASKESLCNGQYARQR